MDGGQGPQASMHLQVTSALQLTGVAVQLVEMLGLTQREIDDVVAAQLDANPALVRGDPRRCRWCASCLRWGRCPTCSGPGGDLRELDPAGPVDAREQVRRDARALVPRGVEDAVDAVLGLLDDRGLLPGGLGAAGPAGDAGTRAGPPAHPGTTLTAADVDRLGVALDAVRSVAPPGTAEPDLRACLLAQARWHAARGAPPLVLEIVRDHLVASGPDELVRRLPATRAEVDEALRFVRRRLTPAPLPREPAGTPTVPPDVVVREVQGRFVADALDAADLGLTLDGELASLPLDPAAAAWRAGHLADAARLLYLLDRRADTLRRVTTAALDVQGQFLRHGRAAHRPLTRAEVAARLGLHASTVSRVVQGAVAGLPGDRVMPLAAFFGTTEAAREAVQELYASADPPRTDAEACARLDAVGVHVARRTVAKYRALRRDDRPVRAPAPR